MESATKWLALWREGDNDAIDRVTTLIHADLRRWAAYHLRSESNVTSLQATAVVHEVYLKMSSLREVDWEGREHFISVVTNMMRRILGRSFKRSRHA